MKCKNCEHDLNWKGDLHLKLTSKKKGYSSNICMELHCGCTNPEPDEFGVIK